MIYFQPLFVASSGGGGGGGGSGGPGLFGSADEGGFTYMGLPIEKHVVQGYNGDVDIAAEEDIWPNGGDIAYPASALATTIESGSANDTAAGTGARTVKVTGMNASYGKLEETVTLNGTSQVSLANTYYRINKVEVMTAGSGGKNAGDLSLKQSSTVIHVVETGINRSRMAAFTPYANRQNWIVPKVYFASLAATNCYGKLMTRKPGGVWEVRMDFNSATSISVPLAVDPGEDIKIRAVALADNSVIAAGFDVAGSSAPL